MKRTDKQKKTAYFFLLAVILLIGAGILSLGYIRASYENKAVWNTVIHPKQSVVSNCLTSDGQVILLGELTEESMIEVWFDSQTEETGNLRAELVDPSQGTYLTVSVLKSEITLSEGRTYGYMNLTPTELASQLKEPLEVEILMTLETEKETLSGLFVVTLPAKEEEKPQKKILTFKFEDVFNVDGTFTVSDTDGIVSNYTISVAEAGATSAVVAGNNLWAVPSAEPVKTDVSVIVEVTLKADAVAGKECTVSFEGIYGDGNEEPGNEKDVYQSVTITVKKKETPEGSENLVDSKTPTDPENPTDLEMPAQPETSEAENNVSGSTANGVSGNTGENNSASVTIEDENSVETQTEELTVAGELSVSALASFALEGGLPISTTLPENSKKLIVSLTDGELPAFTRYSADGGENWYMLYYGGSICVDVAEMPVFEGGQCLLLDLYYTDWSSSDPLYLSVVARAEDGLYTGEVESEATAVLFQTRTVETPLMMGVSSPLEVAVPEGWAECEKEFSLDRLELYNGSTAYRAVNDNSVWIEFGEDNVTVSVGDILPTAGTYCLTIRYKYGGVCFAESEITFFVNYSSVA